MASNGSIFGVFETDTDDTFPLVPMCQAPIDITLKDFLEICGENFLCCDYEYKGDEDDSVKLADLEFTDGEYYNKIPNPFKKENA